MCFPSAVSRLVVPVSRLMTVQAVSRLEHLAALSANVDIAALVTPAVEQL